MDKKILKKLGDRIRLLRMDKELTQENMAIDLGISITAYSKIERGQTNISYLRLLQIAEVLGVSSLKITHPDVDRHSDNSIIVRDYNPNQYDTVSLLQRVHRLEEDIHQFQKILVDKEDIITLLKEKLTDK
ncbi:MAG: helix-turn-helix domain-containing protein [Bacteroidales bacterium]|nr:helix-turn-helix domain-containing protein [Bacteroidales bacterium]MCL2132833.1 helix-turn-helix domain-containing protein [Bacteroidales bacterium]